MITKIASTVTICICSFLSTASYAEPIIFPAQGQSAEQLEKDKYECYTWAKNSSGFDPMSASAAAAPQTKQRSGGALRGAVRGAVLGEVFGSSKTNTRSAAAAGAVVGGVRQSSANEQNQEKVQQQASAERDKYDRAQAACLEGKGYTVK